MATVHDGAATVREAVDRHPLVPLPHRVVSRRAWGADVVTLGLEPVDGEPISYRCGQFAMVTAFGVGEVPLSFSSRSGPGPLEHTVRDVGAVTHALATAGPGDVVGVRGPFGTAWGVDELTGGSRAHDPVVVVGGGIGLAPLRGAIEVLTATPDSARRTTVLVGARSPDQIVFDDDLDRWGAAGATVAVTVDAGARGWDGHVGVVTSLLGPRLASPERTTALVCGPEVMIRFATRALADRGVAPGRILVALERNMQCGLGWCGHCQLGPLVLCRDGPVVDAGRIGTLLEERER